MALSTWIDQHIEEFLRPRLGRYGLPIPNWSDNKYGVGSTVTPWSWERMNHIVDLWLKAKQLAKDDPLLLAGRDTWTFEILARLEGFPTTFRPEISTEVSSYIHKVEDFSKFFAIDTGYRGTVMKNLKVKDWSLISHTAINPPVKKELLGGTTQEVASYMECSPKYWNTGAIKFGNTYNAQGICEPACLDPLSISFTEFDAQSNAFDMAARYTLYLANLAMKHYKFSAMVRPSESHVPLPIVPVAPYTKPAARVAPIQVAQHTASNIGQLNFLAFKGLILSSTPSNWHTAVSTYNVPSVKVTGT